MTLPSYCAASILLFLGLMGAFKSIEIGTELSCWAGGYSMDAWLAYCNSKRYGVYDVEAVWHRIESEVASRIESARVLTLSDSHLQSALSLGGAGAWFAAHGYPAYFLGLPTAESGFGERLIDNFHPHPRVLILDASPYFTGDFGAFERGIFEDPAASRAAVAALAAFQARHHDFCESFPWACGHTFAYFRSRVDGHWIFPAPSNDIWIGANDVPNDDRRFPVGKMRNELSPLYPKYLEAARRLVSKVNLPPRCIVITNVPAEQDLPDLAEYVGQGLGATVIVPRVQGLATFDRAHLTPESSTRWSQAFLAELEPVLHECGAGDDSTGRSNEGL